MSTRFMEEPLQDVLETFSTLERLGVTPDHHAHIRTNPTFAKKIALFITNGGKDITVSVGVIHVGEYVLAVNYDEKLSRAIKKGEFDFVDDGITSQNFPGTRKGSREISAHLFRCDKDVPFADLVKAIECEGFKLGEMRDLLALDKSHPKLMQEREIIAPGEVWRDEYGVDLVPELNRPSLGRHLTLERIEYVDTRIPLFLAIKEVQVS